MEVIKIKNLSATTKVVRYSGNKEKLLAQNETLVITDELLAKNEDVIMAINAGEMSIVEPENGWILYEVIAAAATTAAADYTITIPDGEEWLISSLSITTSAGTADVYLDGKKVIADATNTPAVVVNTTTFGQVFKVTDTIRVDQKTSTGNIAMTIIGTKQRSFM